jgi:ankyrin repeat domain-containing protein 17
MIKLRKNQTTKNSFLMLFLSFILLCIAILNYGCTDYRHILEARGIEYSGHSFIRQAAKGNIENVDLFIKSGMDVNSKEQTNSTALMVAASNGHIDIVKMLLENGANINDVDNSNSTALMHAAYTNHVEIVKILISKKAKLNIRNNLNETALRHATRANNAEVVKALNDVGASED